MIWVPMAALAAAGLLKGELIDRPREDRQRKLAAETERYSPWTGMRPGAIQEADPFGNMLQGAAAGAGFGQALEAHDMAMEMDKAKLAHNLAGNATSSTASLASNPYSLGLDYNAQLAQMRNSPWLQMQTYSQ